jgi:hypothetical protein
LLREEIAGLSTKENQEMKGRFEMVGSMDSLGIVTSQWGCERKLFDQVARQKACYDQV